MRRIFSASNDFYWRLYAYIIIMILSDDKQHHFKILEIKWG